jgi:hypothetical protein
MLSRGRAADDEGRESALASMLWQGGAADDDGRECALPAEAGGEDGRPSLKRSLEEMEADEGRRGGHASFRGGGGGDAEEGGRRGTVSLRARLGEAEARGWKEWGRELTGVGGLLMEEWVRGRVGSGGDREARAAEAEEVIRRMARDVEDGRREGREAVGRMELRWVWAWRESVERVRAMEEEALRDWWGPAEGRGERMRFVAWWWERFGEEVRIEESWVETERRLAEERRLVAEERRLVAELEVAEDEERRLRAQLMELGEGERQEAILPLRLPLLSDDVVQIDYDDVVQID